MRTRRPPRRVRLPARLENGDDILERQMTPEASGFRQGQGFGAEEGGHFGGGTSPLKTRDTIYPKDYGKLAEWIGDGFLRISRRFYPSDPPADGQTYGWQWPDGWVVITGGGAGGIGEAPSDGRTYTRTGVGVDDSLWGTMVWGRDRWGAGTHGGEWVPLPYIIPEAPTDGQGYIRIGATNTWSAAFTQAQADARYQPIGAGGMGTVFLARDTILNRQGQVAVKMIR